MFRSHNQWARSRVALFTAISLLGAFAPGSIQAADNRAPEVPQEIAVDNGYKVHFHAYAEGVQIYTWNGSSWGSSVPEAILYDEERSIVGIHYGGPTWESASGSKVVAAVAAPRVTVDPDAIPWLLLKTVSTEGSGILQHTTYIQRVNTVGGKAPAHAGAEIGEVARVPYAADYFFFREAND